MNKFNCQGAQTQLFTPHKTHTLFDMSLDENEGLVLTDPEIWTYQQEHTPVKQKYKGIRDTLGILLKVDD